MKSKAYWLKRALQRQSAIDKLSQAELNEIRKIYDSAQRDLTKMINEIYSTYSKKAGIDVSELKRLLSYSETDKFWKSLEGQNMQQYIMENYKSRISRLEQYQAKLQARCNELAEKQEKAMSIGGRNAIRSSYSKTVYDTSIGVNADLSFATLDDRTINRILKEKWIGSNYSDRVWKNTDLLAGNIKDILTRAVMTGASQSRAIMELRDRMGVEWYKAERLVRTEMNHFHNQAEKEAYEDMGVEKYVYVATLDNRTSEICQELDGKIFKLSEAQEGVNYPPMHPFCRSTVRAYISEEVEKSMKRRARDEEGNNEIIENMSYSEWLKSLKRDKEKEIENESKNAAPFSEFISKIDNNWNELHSIPHGTDKNIVTELLDKLGFEDSYLVGEIDKKLVNGSNKVLLTKSNLAYVLLKHGDQFSGPDAFYKMRDVLQSTTVIKGKSGEEGDLKFHKLYTNSSGNVDGYELFMNRRSKTSDDYIVHYMQRRGKKAMNNENKFLKIMNESGKK